MAGVTDHYDENARHCIRPAAPADRESAQSTTLAAWQALKLRTGLREMAFYEWADKEPYESETQHGRSTSNNEDEGNYHSIALAYAEYIDTCVRDERQETVQLYAHTDVAEDVLEQAFAHEELGDPFTDE